MYSSNPTKDTESLPKSVIIIGHSMGGIVARTMLTLPNYLPDSINTILTLSTPHAVPPETFDWDMVTIYDQINNYWRDSFFCKRELSKCENNLDSVALISIAGGKLDQVVPSDYASVSSFLPSTNGFTVFTSSIPKVWTGVDHLAIVWCDQCRKAIARALLEIVDVRQTSQTIGLHDRMAVFTRLFMTGLEQPSLKSSLNTFASDTLVTFSDFSIKSLEKWKPVSQSFNSSRQPRIQLIDIPKRYGQEEYITVLTDRNVFSGKHQDGINILLCSKEFVGGTEQILHSISLATSDSAHSNISCFDTASDIVILPASTSAVRHAYDGDTFSYLKYRLADIVKFDYLVFILSDTSHEGFISTEIVDSTAQSYEMAPLSIGMHLSRALDIQNLRC